MTAFSPDESGADAQDAVPSSKLCGLGFEVRFSFKFEIHRRGQRRSRRLPPPPYSKKAPISPSSASSPSALSGKPVLSYSPDPDQKEPVSPSSTSSSSAPLLPLRKSVLSYGPDPDPPPVVLAEKESVPIVRRGPVRGEECGPNRSWFFRVRWLELTDGYLDLYRSEHLNRPAAVRIPLTDIVKCERIADEPCALLLETTKKQYLLHFRNDEEIYGWHYDLDWKYAQDRRSNITGTGNGPWNFVHNVHVGYDPISGMYTGLPLEWRNMFPSSDPSSQVTLALTRHRPPPRDVPSDVRFNEKDRDRISVDLTSLGRMLVSTTLLVTPDTPLWDVFARVCKKVNVDPEQYVFCASSKLGVALGLEGTVADLQGNHDLVLVNVADLEPVWD